MRHWGCLAYDNALSSKVDGSQELKANSPEEVAIRAATVVAVEELVSRMPSMTAVKLDWYLWQLGEQMNQKGDLKPFHRVRTIFY